MAISFHSPSTDRADGSAWPRSFFRSSDLGVKSISATTIAPAQPKLTRRVFSGGAQPLHMVQGRKEPFIYNFPFQSTASTSGRANDLKRTKTAKMQ